MTTLDPHMHKMSLLVEEGESFGESYGRSVYMDGPVTLGRTGPFTLHNLNCVIPLILKFME